jgi:hypothetical protein
MSSWRSDLAFLLGAFALGTAIALVAGAKNLGTALTFGEIAFAGTLVYVLLKRD